MSSTASLVLVDSVPVRRTAEVQDAYDYLLSLKVGGSVLIDADSVSLARTAARHLHREHEEIQIKFRTAAEPAGAVYATKISG